MRLCRRGIGGTDRGIIRQGAGKFHYPPDPRAAWPWSCHAKPSLLLPSGDAAPRPLHPENIPGELKTIPRWLLWKLEDRAGKPTKTPYQASGALAKVNDPATWTDFDTVLTAYLRGGWSGVGIVLTEDDDLVGVDLDKVLNPDTGELAPDAARIVNDLPTYCEVSPSGRGLRLFGFGKLPQGGRRKGHVEMYESGRYLTVTGNQFNGHGSLEEITPQLAQVHARIFAKPDPVDAKPRPAGSAEPGRCGRYSTRPATPATARTSTGSGRAILSGARRRPFRRRPGAVQSAGVLDGQRRGADGPAVSAVGTVPRPKWDKVHFADGRTYGQATIEKAIAGCRETYSGRKAEGRDHRGRARS